MRETIATPSNPVATSKTSATDRNEPILVLLPRRSPAVDAGWSAVAPGSSVNGIGPLGGGTPGTGSTLASKR
jgi:hypothetical protein